MPLADNEKPGGRILNRRSWFLAALTALLLLTLGIVYRDAIASHLKYTLQLITDKERVAAFIGSFGIFAPLAFIAFQFLQVIFAPVPGEASGFIGGYIFGVGKGFLFSTIGLTLGSWANFLIGRFLGNRYVRRLIPEKTLKRFDEFLRHQGAIVVFFLFVFPGFPKDYLCLFLGLGNLSVKLFMIISTIGRMPGTMMLSLQGALLSERDYVWLAVLMIGCLVLVIPLYRYREELYRWIEKLNHKPGGAS
jgi:uncharacterized membrane protein YdjX (TVP38/TMEM64 family)